MILFLACMSLGFGVGIGACSMLVIANSLTIKGRRKAKRIEFIRQASAKIYIELLRDGTEERYSTQKMGDAIWRAERLWKDIEELEVYDED